MKAKKRRPHRRAVLVRWVDSAACGEWVGDQEEQPAPLTIWTLGWVIKETKTALVVSSSVTDSKGRHGQSNAPIAIPKLAIKERAEVTISQKWKKA